MRGRVEAVILVMPVLPMLRGHAAAWDSHPQAVTARNCSRCCCIGRAMGVWVRCTGELCGLGAGLQAQVERPVGRVLAGRGCGRMRLVAEAWCCRVVLGAACGRACGQGGGVGGGRPRLIVRPLGDVAIAWA